MPIDTITIGAEESAWLPKGAKILAVDATDGLTLSSPSNCINTTAPARVCAAFYFSVDDHDVDDTDALDNIRIKTITVGTTPYTINYDFASLTEATEEVDILTKINSANIPGVTVEQVLTGDGTSRKDVTIKFRSPSDYLSKMEMKIGRNVIDGDRWKNDFYVKPIAIDCEEIPV